MTAHTYRDLIVWKKSIQLVLDVYKLTEKFPKEEIHGLTSQMRRAAISIPSNIAEGKLRNGAKECRQFLFIAYGSGGELETQIEIAKQLSRTKDLAYTDVELILSEVMKILNVLIYKSDLTSNA